MLNFHKQALRYLPQFAGGGLTWGWDATKKQAMSTIQEQLTSDMKEAMKEKNQTALAAIRALKTAIMNVCVEKGLGPQGVLPEVDAISVVKKQIKQRQDSVASFEQGGRPDLADKEKAEIAILEKYCPAMMSEEQIAAAVDAVLAELQTTSKKDMGRVMKALQERTAGRADGRLLSTLVGQKLS